MGRAEKSQRGESFSVNCADPSRRMARLAVFLFSLGLAAAQKGRAIESGSAIGSGPPQVNFKGKNPNALNVTRVPAKGGVTVGKQGKCNDLEALVNRERGSSGLRPLHCDANMRWVAYQHLDDADEGAQQNLAWGDECNLHSWLVKFPCCYTSDHANGKCVWNKPLQLSGWDDRTGFEISAWRSDKMSATQAINQWRGSFGHYDVIMGRSGWDDLKTVGCGYRNNHAHCWFAKIRP